MNGGQPQPDEQRDQGAGDLHVLVVGHRQDDDQQESRAEHLVDGQGGGGRLGNIINIVIMRIVIKIIIKR